MITAFILFLLVAVSAYFTYQRTSKLSMSFTFTEFVVTLTAVITWLVVCGLALLINGVAYATKTRSIFVSVVEALTDIGTEAESIIKGI